MVGDVVLIISDPDYHLIKGKNGDCVQFVNLVENDVPWDSIDGMCFDVEENGVLSVILFARGYVLCNVRRHLSLSAGFVLDSRESIRVECHFKADRLGLAAKAPHVRCF